MEQSTYVPEAPPVVPAPKKKNGWKIFGWIVIGVVVLGILSTMGKADTTPTIPASHATTNVDAFGLTPTEKVIMDATWDSQPASSQAAICNGLTTGNASLRRLLVQKFSGGANISTAEGTRDLEYIEATKC